MTNVDLARWQFAFVTINHFFFVPITIRLPDGAIVFASVPPPARVPTMMTSKSAATAASRPIESCCLRLAGSKSLTPQPG